MAEQNNGGAVATREPSAGAQFRDQLNKMGGEIEAGLPPHMSVERFMRVVLTAVNENPDLLYADRRSLLASSMRAAQDGLLPDGREGALVVYRTKVPGKDGERDKWIKKVQWMPMVVGLLKKARNSGEIVAIEAHVVYSKDRFLYVLGDNPRIEHEPNLETDDPGEPRFAYAIAWLKNGGIIREVMTRRQVDQVKAASKNADPDKPNAIWNKWRDEMWRKTAFRRLFKWLPRSAEMDDLIRRDDEDNGLEDRAGLVAAKAGLFEPVRDPLSDMPGGGDGDPASGDDGEVDPDTGEVTKIVQSGEQGRVDPKRADDTDDAGERAEEADSKPVGQKTAAEPEPEKSKLEVTPSLIESAKKRGVSGRRNGMPRSAVPKEFKIEGNEPLRDAWLDGWDEEAAREKAAEAPAPKGSARGGGTGELGGL